MLKNNFQFILFLLSFLWLPTLAIAAKESNEKLLFGFERAEVEKAVKDKKNPNFKEMEAAGFQFFAHNGGVFHEHEMAAIRPMRCVKSNVSQGEYACRIQEVIGRDMIRYPNFRLPRINALDLFLNEPQANQRLPELLNTAGWYDWVFPRDWSGYDLLRIDVLIESSEVKALRLEVEDDLVEPPVSHTYVAPEPGKWITVELDLAQAVTDRKLDLKAMRNIWLRVVLKDIEKNAREVQDILLKNKNIKVGWRGKSWAPVTQIPEALARKRFIAYVDNIRICKKGTPGTHTIMKGERSVYTQKLPRAYSVWDKYDAKHDARLNLFDQTPTVLRAPKTLPESKTIEWVPAPTTLAKPSIIPIRDMILSGTTHQRFKGDHNSVRLTCTSALDAEHIIVGFYLFKMGSMKSHPTAVRRAASSCGAAVATNDGGRTWKGLDGTDWPTSLGGNISKPVARPVDLMGDVMGVFPFGCGGLVGAHIGYPADRAFFVRSVYTGKDWWVSPKYFISGDMRHCHDIRFADAVGTPSGRIWTAWSGRSRGWYEGGPQATFVYRSDDGGASWSSWRGAGLTGGMPRLGSVIRLAPYGEHIAVIGKKSWSWFDGKTWSKPELYPRKLDLYKGRFTSVWHTVSFGKELYITSNTGKIAWHDGTVWQDFKLPGRTGIHGKMGVCDWKTLVFVEIDAAGKKILCWQKKEGGTWKGPQVLIEEQKKIVRIAHQRYAPKGFMPIAYMCESGIPQKKRVIPKSVYFNFPDAYPIAYEYYEPWIKVLKVPVTD